MAWLIMSRADYPDDCDDLGALWLYRQAVENAICGKRGQAFMRDLRSALTTMPCQELASGALISAEGVCAMGAVAIHRGIDRDVLAKVNPHDWKAVGKLLDIAPSMVREVAFVNDDEWFENRTGTGRFNRMLDWAYENTANG